MAFNWQTFRTRTVTAIVFAAVMLTGLLWNHWSFLVLFSIIHFGCWWEYFKLIEKIYRTSFHHYSKLGFMLMGYGLVLWFCGEGFYIGEYLLKDNFSMPVSAAGFILAAIGLFRQGPVNFDAFGIVLLGLFYISMSWGMMMGLRSMDLYYIDVKQGWYDTGWIIPITIVSAIWINDTMAYIVGSLIGKTPLSKISPKKTWEGTVGGVILCVVTLSVIAYFSKWMSVKEAAIVAAICAIAGTFGDLLESKLKRMAGVKDSGSFMPGHGGFLDRFDSLLLAIPFVWLYVYFFI